MITKKGKARQWQREKTKRERVAIVLKRVKEMDKNKTEEFRKSNLTVVDYKNCLLFSD